MYLNKSLKVGKTYITIALRWQKQFQYVPTQFMFPYGVSLSSDYQFEMVELKRY